MPLRDGRVVIRDDHFRRVSLTFRGAEESTVKSHIVEFWLSLGQIPASLQMHSVVVRTPRLRQGIVEEKRSSTRSDMPAGYETYVVPAEPLQSQSAG